MELEDIVKELEKTWNDKVDKSRNITLGTGKGGVILHWETLTESLTGKKPTKEERQKYSDTLLSGYYTISTKGISGPTFSDEENEDGLYAVHRWAREDKNGKRYGEKYLVEVWKDGYGNIVREITEEEYNKLKE